MGVYINHPDGKEAWLQENAIPISTQTAEEHNDYKDIFLVVLVQNMLFSAAAVAFSEEEKKHFLDPSDFRPKLYFLVEKSKMSEETQHMIDIYQKARQ